MKISFIRQGAGGRPHGSTGLRLRRGFTLLELTLVMVSGIIAGSMMLSLFNQQITFLQMYRTQNFLIEEAPIISTYTSRIISRADRFRLHESLEDALAGRNALTEGPVAVLNFRQPDGSMRASIFSFEDRGDGPQLYYFIVPEVGPLGEPEWTVTNAAENVLFVIEDGVLRMTLTGPAGEEITYSGSMQL